MPADLCPRCAELATALAERDREIEWLRSREAKWRELLGLVWFEEDDKRTSQLRRELGLDGEEQP